MSDDAFRTYGFTNDARHIEHVRAFRDAAVADGWTIEPTYGDHESIERASRLRKNGFVMLILTRDKRNDDPRFKGKWDYEAHVDIWGPDGGHVGTPQQYDWAAIQEGTHICDECKRRVEKTQHYAFAGRCCEECLPAMRKKYEYPGWCD